MKIDDLRFPLFLLLLGQAITFALLYVGFESGLDWLGVMLIALVYCIMASLIYLDRRGDENGEKKEQH